ncbi:MULTISPECIES: hypothetical protein [unclassified Streptomyces]|uniref:hypothetical protein n=1 Tax=unclassified Streptomyces TaxID=2593676 RepID=UPI0038150DFF
MVDRPRRHWRITVAWTKVGFWTMTTATNARLRSVGRGQGAGRQVSAHLLQRVRGLQDTADAPQRARPHAGRGQP